MLAFLAASETLQVFESVDKNAARARSVRMVRIAALYPFAFFVPREHLRNRSIRLLTAHSVRPSWIANSLTSSLRWNSFG